MSPLPGPLPEPPSRAPTVGCPFGVFVRLSLSAPLFFERLHFLRAHPPPVVHRHRPLQAPLTPSHFSASAQTPSAPVRVRFCESGTPPLTSCASATLVQRRQQVFDSSERLNPLVSCLRASYRYTTDCHKLFLGILPMPRRQASHYWPRTSLTGSWPCVTCLALWSFAVRLRFWGNAALRVLLLLPRTETTS